jgi:integrase
LTRTKINQFVLERTDPQSEGRVGNRTANLDVLALNNMLNFAKSEGWLKGELPTDKWKELKYTAPCRSLLSIDDITKLCAEATVKVEGKPKHLNGQFLADYIKLLAFSGARRQAGLSLKWNQVDWSNRQLTLFSKFDKRVIVDFNEKLEAHLKDLFERRDPDSPWVFPTPRSGEMSAGYFANPQKVLLTVTEALGMNDFHLHDLRHWFISYAIMSGIDTLTVASWVGHADGGVLIGKTYGHLNPQHKREAASKLRFDQPEQAPA